MLFLLAPGTHETAILSSLQEVRARGTPTIDLALEGAQGPDGLADHTRLLPHANAELVPLVFTGALHLLSYGTAEVRGLPIDKPCNLAKSVTVE